MLLIGTNIQNNSDNVITLSTTSAATITGLHIEMDPVGTLQPAEVAIYDETGTNLTLGLTAVSTAVTSLGDLSDGEFGTDSITDDNENILNEGWPTAEEDFSPGTASFHSTSGSNVNMNLFFKFTEAKKIAKISIILENVRSGYPRTSFTVKDQDDNILTPFLEPKEAGDIVWGEDVPATVIRVNKAYGYSWYYPDFELIDSFTDIVGSEPVVYIDPNTGTLDNQGSGGSAYDMDLGSLSITEDGLNSYVEADGTNILSLKNALSGATLYDNLRRTDGTQEATFVMICNIASIASTADADVPQLFGVRDYETSSQEVGWMCGIYDENGWKVHHRYSDDNQEHNMHSDATNSVVPLGADFGFVQGHRNTEWDGIVDNNEYRGVLFTELVDNKVSYYNWQADKNQKLTDHTPEGASATSSAYNTNPGFWMMGCEDNNGTKRNVWESGSKFYSFLAFDSFLTITQQIKLFHYMKLIHRREIDGT